VARQTRLGVEWHPWLSQLCPGTGPVSSLRR
jgi:hypothetical protein